MPNVPIPQFSLTPLSSLGRAIESLEALLLRGRVQDTARHNAWSAVCADRERAQDRREAERVLSALAGAALPSGGGRVEPRS